MSRDYEEQKRVMNLSLVVAVVLLCGKVAAATITGSSAIYSDAVESVVHTLAVCFAVWALRLAHKPADETHHFGHDKVAFLSSGFEGAMISSAALLITYEAIRQFIFGVKLENIGVGVALTAATATVNLVLGLFLVRVGKRKGSPLIRANGLHVLTDVWSSVAVMVALGLVLLTDWLWWDPIAAMIAAANILHTGFKLMRESLRGLLDETDPEIEDQVRRLLERETASRDMAFHNLRYRHSGRFHWVEFHLVCADGLTVGRAHELATEVEASVAALLDPDGRVISHLEPRSQEDHEEAWEEK